MPPCADNPIILPTAYSVTGGRPLVVTTSWHMSHRVQKLSGGCGQAAADAEMNGEAATKQEQAKIPAVRSTLPTRCCQRAALVRTMKDEIEFEKQVRTAAMQIAGPLVSDKNRSTKVRSSRQTGD